LGRWRGRLVGMETPAPELERSLTLRGAVTLNLLDMIGVGPFLTLPLLLGAMGGPQAMLGWVLGAVLAACDGMVWAELGAMMPEAGGTYAYLGKMFPGQWGRWLSFLFVFQLMVSAPLSVASGCIGLAQYAGFLMPGVLGGGAVVHAVGVGPWRFGVSAGTASWMAVGVVVVAVVLLYRRLAKMKWLAVGMLVVVLGTMGWAMVTGVLHGSWARVVAFPAGAWVWHHGWHVDHGFFLGLGSAMLIATYDYWGYYNVTFLGGEVRQPGKTVPRAVLWSIAIVAVLYLGLNASVLAVMGAPAVIAAGASLDARRALLSEFMRVAYTPGWGLAGGLWLGRVAAALVMVTAFASVFALLLGYSRIPFAAARDGNFPAAFGRLHRTRGFPVVSWLVLAGVACLFCFFSLGDVIAALVVLRILLQFGLQHVGVMVLRVRRREMRRPFRMWLYPLPPLLALLGFGFLVVSRAGFGREVALAAVVAVSGSVVFGLRAVVASKRAREA
jgi:amino acid transporter